MTDNLVSTAFDGKRAFFRSYDSRYRTMHYELCAS